MMHGLEKSDSAVVATKPANKAGRPAAERAEPRTGTKENAPSHTRDGHRAAVACHRGWTVYGTLRGSGRRSGSLRCCITSRSIC